MTKRSVGPARDDERSLRKRYLFWLYKTTKDELDKIDRKFTQLEIDRRIQELLSRRMGGCDKALRQGVGFLVKEWGDYIVQKESDALRLKFSEGGAIDPQYLFLRWKLDAVERLTRTLFGPGLLREFKARYEEAAMKMIAQDTSGRR